LWANPKKAHQQLRLHLEHEPWIGITELEKAHVSAANVYGLGGGHHGA
jgi:hypothetical protein